MRIAVVALCLVFSQSLWSAEENGTPEVEPVIVDKNADNSSQAKKHHQGNTSDESEIRFTVGEFERLIKAIRGHEEQDNDRDGSSNAECDDPRLSYAEFIGCEDLKAQKEMATGTTHISDYARTTVVISWWALLFLFLSLVAASIAAYYAKRTANAAERSDGAFVDIELSTNPEKFFEMDLKNDPNMTISILISNYGNTPARKLRYKITPVYKGNQPIFCEGLIGIFPPSTKGTEKFLKDFASVDTTFNAASWLMGKGTDFVVEWEFETIFSEKVRAFSYTAKFQSDTDGIVDRNTTYQNFSTWFQRVDESESVRARAEKQEQKS